MDRYYVFPRDGEWVARKGEADEGEELGAYADRAAAMEAARDHRGDEREDLYRMNDAGEYERVGALVHKRGPEALWLLREDGSVYGEVDNEVQEGGRPIVMTIAPASEQSSAGE